MRPVLALDQGTSSTKALVVCPERGVLATASVPVHPRYGEGGAVETDPQAMLNGVLVAAGRALAQAGEPVSAVGLANQGETVLAWDPATGRPLTPAIGWQDRRSAALCEALDPSAPELLELTGLPLDPYFAAPKLAWIRRELTREGVVTTSDTWLAHALTGAYVTDAATASRTMLLDLDAAAWSPRAVSLFGLDGEQLPGVVDCAGPVGAVAAFGGVPLSGLAVDQQAALLGQACLRVGDAKCTYGTGAFLLANVGEHAARSGNRLATSIAWALPTSRALPTSPALPTHGGHTVTYCLDGQVHTVAAAVQWLADLGVIAEAAELDAVGSTVTDAGGVVFVPAFAGLGAPTWRSSARASVSGLSLRTTRGHLIRALLDGIAAQVVDLAEAVAADLGAPLTGLRADGGLTRSRLLMQVQADLLQRPVQVHASPDATALGVAALAMLGADPSLDPAVLADLVAARTPPTVYEPAISADEAAGRLASIRAASALS